MLDKIKIIFIDLDGTLLDINQNGTHDISNKNKEAIVKAKKEGKHIIISTGRSEMQAEKYLSKLNYTYAVTGNGSIILKHNRIIRKIEMNIRTTLLLVNYVRKNKLLIKVDGNRNVYNCYSLIQKIFAKKFRFIPFSNINLDLHKKYHKFII
jgi:hydroxymethylpyrimidine pyrophosphatase-like HAD family hydrolase